MTRRRFVPAVAGAALASSAGAANTEHSIIELRRFDLRNTVDNQKQRTTEFLEHTALPALRRAGMGPVGFFANTIAPDGPFLIQLLSFPSFGAMGELVHKLENDSEYRKGLIAFNSGPQPGYERMESRLLLSFGMPQIVPPPQSEGRHAGHLFELRMYESPNSTTLRRKIRMFNEGEMAIFQRLGMQPVFFGETIIGTKMPNLCYMLSFDDLAARERLWKAFGSDPEWQKLRAKPGYSDGEIVSNISNIILSPLPFSQIR